MAEFPSVLDLSTLDGTNGFRLDGEAGGDRAGIAVSGAGDFNGDGFADVIVGVDKQSAAYVVFGGPGGLPSLSLGALDGTNGVKLRGIVLNDQAGSAVSSAGDINGDGIDDLIIGAYRADPKGDYSGLSYVIFGRTGGFPDAINLQALDGTDGFRLNGSAAYERASFSVSKAGDINGDGFGDLIVGAPGLSDGNEFTGGAYVLFGKATPFAANINLSTLTGNSGFKIFGAEEGDYAGRSVSAAGDMNGDGFGDLLIGADGVNPGAVRAGAAYVVFGKASGFGANVDLAALDGANGFRISGINGDDRVGFECSEAGDVNGDGFGDIIVSADGDDANGPIAGAAFVIFGKAASFEANFDLSAIDGRNGFKLSGADKEDLAGSAVSGAGDVNGDGFDDVIIGAFQADAGGGGISGASYVVFGKAGGFDANIDVTSLNGRNGFQIAGVDPGDNLGLGVSAAGDVNRDGFDDVIVGSRGADNNALNDSGSSYVIYGRAPDDAVIRTGSAASQKIMGGAFNDRLSGLGGNDTLNGGDGRRPPRWRRRTRPVGGRRR